MLASRKQYRVSYRLTPWPPSRPTVEKVFTQVHLAVQLIASLRAQDDGTLQLAVDERIVTHGPWSPSKIGGSK